MDNAGDAVGDRGGPGRASGEASAYRFLSGAEMEPGTVLAAYPGARFEARARLAEPGDGDVWGILIRTASSVETDAGDVREVVTDDGRRVRAAAAGGGRPTGEPDAVLAAARYWELPPSYVRRLPGAGEVD